MEYRWRGFLQIIFGLGLAFLFFYMMAPFIVAILLGAVIAIVCFPLYQKLTRRLPPPLAGLIVDFSVVVGILLPLALVLYSASYKLLGVIATIKIPKTPTGVTGEENFLNHPWIQKILTTVQGWAPVDPLWLQEQLGSVAHSVLESLSRGIASTLASIPGLLLAFTVVVLSIYFFLVDGAKFLTFLQGLSPMKADKSYELYSAFEKSCRGVVLGLFASALVQGALMAIFFWITGIPNALLIGTITIVLAMVPLFGSAPAGIGGVIYLFLNHHPVAAVVMIFGAVLISLSDNVVRPIIMKGQSEMHPMLALVSVFGALNLMGATGIFLGPIIAAVFVSFLKITSQEIRKEKMLATQVLTPNP